MSGGWTWLEALPSAVLDLGLPLVRAKPCTCRGREVWKCGCGTSGSEWAAEVGKESCGGCGPQAAASSRLPGLTELPRGGRG